MDRPAAPIFDFVEWHSRAQAAAASIVLRTQCGVCCHCSNRFDDALGGGVSFRCRTTLPPGTGCRIRLALVADVEAQQGVGGDRRARARSDERVS
jgi:hypothetical protein